MIQNTYPQNVIWEDSHYTFSEDGILKIYHWREFNSKTGDKCVGEWYIEKFDYHYYTAVLVDLHEGGRSPEDLGDKMKMQYKIDDRGFLYLAWRNEENHFSKGWYVKFKKTS